MKKFLISLLFLLPVSCFAHEDPADSTRTDKKERKNEFGLDMIYFLNIFRNQWEQANENTMVFTFDHHLKKERIIRFYLSTGFIMSKTKEDTVPLIYNKQTDLIALPGFGWEKHIGKHWAYFYGLQARIENASGINIQGDNTKTGVQHTYFSNWYYGPSGFTGVKFVVNNRISFQTEMDISFNFLNEVNGFSNEKFPSQNYRTTITGFSTEYIIPKTILLNFMF